MATAKTQSTHDFSYLFTSANSPFIHRGPRASSSSTIPTSSRSKRLGIEHSNKAGKTSSSSSDNGDGEKKKQNGDDGRLLHLSASQFSRVFSFFKPMKRSL